MWFLFKRSFSKKRFKPNTIIVMIVGLFQTSKILQ